MNRNYLLSGIIIFLCACNAQKKLSTIDYSPLYNSRFSNPQFKIFHFSNDSSVLYFSLTNNDLLFKKNESEIFQAVIAIEYGLFTSYHKTDVTDSASIIEVINYDSTAAAYSGTLKFKASFGNDYILKIKFQDKNRNFAYLYTININKTNKQSAQFFNVLTQDENTIMQPYINTDTKVKIEHPSLASDSICVRYYHRQFPLAPPPFSDIPPAAFEYSADSIYYLETAKLNDLSFKKQGFYHLQVDTLIKTGLTIFIFDNDFPSFSRSEQLIESLRYLCTRTEYNQLLNQPDKKKAIDEFWLAKAGNNERGRKLIKVYYNRSINANKLFTSYMEGWKTDRGMIYLVFGPPQTVYRDRKYETWYYSVSESLPAVQFTFMKISNPFSDNDYELERNKIYQSNWYQAVDTWRTGRIVGEN